MAGYGQGGSGEGKEAYNHHNTGTKSRDYNYRLQKRDITSLEERRKQLDMIQTFKVERETWFEATNR